MSLSLHNIIRDCQWQYVPWIYITVWQILSYTHVCICNRKTYHWSMFHIAIGLFVAKLQCGYLLLIYLFIPYIYFHFLIFCHLFSCSFYMFVYYYSFLTPTLLICMPERVMMHIISFMSLIWVMSQHPNHWAITKHNFLQQRKQMKNYFTKLWEAVVFLCT
jgi:hypothetical protein